MAIVTTQTSSYLNFNNLDADEETQKIRGRVIVCWRSYKSGSKSTLLEMVLMDEEGVRIHASMDEELLKKSNILIKEGDAIAVNAFEMKDNNGGYRTSPLPHRIVMMRTSLVKIIDDFPTTQPENYFKDFSEIKSGELDKDILIDVIGKVLSVGPLEDVKIKGKTGSSKKMDLILIDTKGEDLVCTMWGDYAKAVSENCSPDDKTLTICVIRFVSIKVYKGNTSVQNAFNATRIYFNPESEYVADFIERLPNKDAMITYSDNTQSTYSGSITKRNEFFTNNKRKTLLGIQQTLELGSFVTSAYVTAVDMTKKWYNVACSICRLKVQTYGHPDIIPPDYRTKYNCRDCDDLYDVVYKYYLILHVSDESHAEMKVLLFDKMAESFVGTPAHILYEEVAGQEKKVLPIGLRELVGKKSLFKLKMEENKEKPMVVEAFWIDENDIDLFEETIAIEDNDAPLMITNNEDDEDIGEDSSLTPMSKRSSLSIESIPIGDQNSVTKKIKLEPKK